MTHTEKVHIYFGLGLCLIGLFALVAIRFPNSRARSVWPVLVFVVGFLLFIPVEAQTRTYQAVGWWETFLSWIPDDVNYWLTNWLAKAREMHVLQHKVAGVFAMMVGVIELGVVRGWAVARWRVAVPWLTILVGLSLGVHGGNSHHLPTVQEQAHHWILGIGFVTAGLVQLLQQRGVLSQPGWRYAWPLVMLLTGADLALFYRLAAAVHGTH